MHAIGTALSKERLAGGKIHKSTKKTAHDEIHR